MTTQSSLLVGLASLRAKQTVGFRVKTGCDLLRGIEAGLAEAGVQTGIFLSGIGAIQKAVFRNLKRFPKEYPVADEDRLYLACEQPMELVSLTGWFAPDEKSGNTYIHAHYSASMVEGDTVVTRGGHLTEGTIAGIKVVIFVSALEEGLLHAGIKDETGSPDLWFNGG
jgi:predicted DNA-binding protein with PD1-like motif